MTRRQRATTSAKLAIAGAILAGGALATAGQAAADPIVPSPTPMPAVPGPPGQIIVETGDDPVVAAPAPPPIGAPPVPEIPNAAYGSSGGGGGFLGSIKDAYNQAKDPYGMYGTVDPMLAPAPPPPGAGPPPPLPPGYVSMTAPGSETIAAPKGPEQTGPALPPGYYPLNGPPPPGYGDPAVQPVVEPIPPTP